MPTQAVERQAEAVAHPHLAGSRYRAAGQTRESVAGATDVAQAQDGPAIAGQRPRRKLGTAALLNDLTKLPVRILEALRAVERFTVPVARLDEMVRVGAGLHGRLERPESLVQLAPSEAKPSALQRFGGGDPQPGADDTGQRTWWRQR